MMPLMPSPSGMAGPQQSGPPQMTPPPGGSSGLAGLLGASPAPAQMDPEAQQQAASQAMMQFDQLAQQIEDLARMFPGNEDVAAQIVQSLQQWRSTVVVSMSPASAMMPGASSMM